MKDEDLELLFDSIKEMDNKLGYVIKKLNDMDEHYFNLYQKHYPFIDDSPLEDFDDFRDLELTPLNMKRMNEWLEKENALEDARNAKMDFDDEEKNVIIETKLKD